ncbi:hypothetical protein [Fibrella forsythiae]|uniref:DUF4747 family protein n=1 Tax=Fibrella forsythiae TaxID=2817061 RepID=A0ABS3JL30_9BACT|nr:hypothetical protein [Fibrella forsythiae]MBO0950703.1 hypothetical protein [Fibrella forsythiae]
MANYSAYRILLSQPDQLQIGRERRSKTQLLNDTIKELSGELKVSFFRGEKRYIFYYVRRIIGTIHLFELAREDTVREPKEGDRGTEEVELTITPFIYFIIDVTKQVVLIQKKTSVFHDTDSAANRIAEFFENQLSNDLVIAQLHPIVRADNFWEEIKEAKEVHSLELDIAPPNFFGTRFKSNIDIKAAHEETNFTKFKIYLSNKYGDLRIAQENFQDLIQTLASGAGDYVADLVDKFGRRITLTNATRKRSISLPDNLKEIDGEKLRIDIDDIDETNNASSNEIKPDSDQ